MVSWVVDGGARYNRSKVTVAWKYCKKRYDVDLPRNFSDEAESKVSLMKHEISCP